MNLKQVYKKFPTEEICLEYIESIRWQTIPKCPYCHSIKITKTQSVKRYHCNECNTSFSVTVGTMFHKTKVDFQKWFFVLFVFFNSKKKVSMRQMSQNAEVNKNTAWLMITKIKKAVIDQEEFLKKMVLEEKNMFEK